MSDLTSCNYCDLRKLQKRYGVENIQVRPADGEMTGWLVAEAFTGNQWDQVAWFMQLTDYCVC